jgi:hypothetical protein
MPRGGARALRLLGKVKFEARIRELVENLPDLAVLVEPIVAALCGVVLSLRTRPRRFRLKTGYRPHWRRPRRHPSSMGRCHSPRSGD